MKKLWRIAGAAAVCIAAMAFIEGFEGWKVVSAGQKGAPEASQESCGPCHPGIAEMKFVHEPAAGESGCSACHAVSEKGDHPPALVLEGQELCFQCHESGKFEGAFTHPPAAEGKCLDCHRPHGSDHSALLKAPPERLCTECHGSSRKEAGAVPGNPPRPEETAAVHSPFGDGKCLSCHVSHAGEAAGLLNGNYPADLYASFSVDTYGFCIQCHDDLKESLSKPRIQSGTAFRNGDLNLHFVHVNQRKGRTCRACHQHHSSESPKLMRRALGFGKKTLEIRFSKTDAGGRCTSPCHFRIEYDRDNPIPNPIRAIAAKRMGGAKAEVSSPVGRGARR